MAELHASPDHRNKPAEEGDIPPLLHLSPHAADHPLYLSLLHSHSLLRHRLHPPFSPLSFSPQELPDLSSALALAFLTSSSSALPRHLLVILHSTSPLSYGLLSSTLLRITLQLFPLLLPVPRRNLLLLLPVLFRVRSPGLDPLLLSLLRRLDPSNPDPSFPSHLLHILSDHLSLLSPLVASSSLFVFLRLLPDHCRLNVKVLVHPETDFCIRLLREQFHLCLPIGRELIRLLQDVTFIPKFRDVWKDLLFSPSAFGVPECTDITVIYRMRIPGPYFLLRVSPEMETQMRFLLMKVKWGSEKRYLEWFGKRFLCRPEQETVLVDLIRFVVCEIHPTNEVLQSGVVPRWVVIGWLLKCCRRSHIQANAKLALFFDWLFFDEKYGYIMDVEPATLLMVHSLAKYADFTCMLLEFLFILVDNYDTERKDMIFHGIQAAFDACVRKCVIFSLEPLVSCERIPTALRNKLSMFVSSSTAN